VKAGAVAFSDDGQTIMNTKILQEALQRSQDLNIPIILHEEDRFLSPQTGMDASGLALRLGLPQSHEGAESVLVARDLRLLMELAPQARVHVAHVSSRGALEELAKARGHHLSVTCEVTPHHLYFDHTRVEEMDGFAKMSPPLRSEPTRLELWKALCAGLIDIIATDHAPHGWTEKAQTFTHAPCGVVGCETAVSTIWTLCNGDQPLFGKLVDCMSAAPAKRFGLEAGSLEEGSPADLVVFDPNAEWKVDGTKLQSRAKHSPWDGEHLTGRVRQTWIDGQNVFDLK
jgi:dihydroorotase